MLFTPPGKFSEAGHLGYIRAVAEQTAVGVMPYLAAPVSTGFLESLLELPNVVAIKDATGDVGWFRRSIRVVRGRMNWLCEGESTAPYTLLHGANGFTSGMANVVPAVSLELYGRAVDGDYVRAGEVQRILDPWADLRAKPGNHVGVVKLALDLCRLAGGPVRLPLLPLSDADQAEVRRLIGSTPGVPLAAAS
jgi:4-hydroxy-tetrahydrodipicolinate synthase